jgi:hypothetical protein
VTFVRLDTVRVKSAPKLSRYERRKNATLKRAFPDQDLLIKKQWIFCRCELILGVLG